MQTDESSETEESDIERIAQCVKGMCVECGDQPAMVTCEQCTDDFCDVCFQALHRKGQRRRHIPKALPETEQAANITKIPRLDTQPTSYPEAESIQKNGETTQDESKPTFTSVGEYFVERAKYIPLRLTFEERKYLRLLEAALNVSEYTDKVDIFSHKTRAKRIVEQVKDICAILSGLLVAADYKAGQRLVKDREFAQNAEFFQEVFEIGRRYKILNPERMRSSYGKLIYFLQDTQIPEVQDLLEFSCVAPLKTVYSLLESKGGLDLLRHEYIEIATRVITPEGKHRYDVQKEIQRKNNAVKVLCRKFAKDDLTVDDVETCLYSINDNNTFLYANRDPCDSMINYLRAHFHPTHYEESLSLSIINGRHGARLTHSHEKQFNYVLQSLTLWREILHDFFKLWYLAENDLLSTECTYRMRDTGQGLNRVQPCPRTNRLMHNILARAQRKVETWVGSSVIHMGDHNVPNALMFIDKYTQVARILGPITTTLRAMDDRMSKQADIHEYIKITFGSIDQCKKIILSDFFRHGFDGSGA
eukprot:Ihof_evm2s538 gene=Ihof_evmTU2s538